MTHLSEREAKPSALLRPNPPARRRRAGPTARRVAPAIRLTCAPAYFAVNASALKDGLTRIVLNVMSSFGLPSIDRDR